MNARPRSARSASLRPPGRPELAEWLRHRPAIAGSPAPEGAPWRLVGASVDVLRAVAGRRLTSRCRLTLVRDGGERRQTTVVAKQYTRPEHARRLARHLRTLRPGPGRASFRVPRLLEWDARRGVVVMEALSGASLDRAMRRLPLGAELEAAGARLATFHRGEARVRLLEPLP